MSNRPNIVVGPGEAVLASELDAVKVILSVVVSLLFWLAVAVAALLLFLLPSSPLDLNSLVWLKTVASWLGVSVIGLTVITWKAALWLVCKYIQWYSKKYAIFS